MQVYCCRKKSYLTAVNKTMAITNWKFKVCAQQGAELRKRLDGLKGMYMIRKDYCNIQERYQ